MEFHKYEITYNTDASNKFQYAEFDKYKESETVEINISESTDQNISTELSIKSSAKMQNINSSDVSHDTSLKIMNISIVSHCSECNWQFTYH